jgi:hypothetical protein
MENSEIKQLIKNYFVDIKEDKFTKVKSVKCKHKIEWTGKDLENNFMPTNNSMSNSLSMSIEYRYKDDIDSIFFVFTYSNADGGYPGMSNIKMYLILDDDKTIELSDASGFDHASQTSNSGGTVFNVYIETAQLSVNMSDFIAIANATKIEYSIRFGHGAIEKVFDSNEIIIFKGFYNTFDNEFEFENLCRYVKNDTKYMLAQQIHPDVRSFMNQYHISQDDLIEMLSIVKDSTQINMRLIMSFRKFNDKYCFKENDSVTLINLLIKQSN